MTTLQTISKLPTSKEVIDNILLGLKENTPVVLPARSNIAKIRTFYIRKVKFACNCIEDRLESVINDFKVLHSCHAFYSLLMNGIFDKKQLELTTKRIVRAKDVVQDRSKDYVKLLKYVDSHNGCRQLKKLALGLMCTVIKRLDSSFAYLEELRMLLSQLPLLDPNGLNLVIVGSRGTGKSSFVGQIANQDEKIVPFSSTEELIRHEIDHKFSKWHVVDTPGITDTIMCEKSSAEIQSLAAVAYLQCCVVYFIDTSEQSSYSIVRQLQIFRDLCPLFADQPVILVANKIDLVGESLESLPSSISKQLESAASDTKALLLPLCNGKSCSSSQAQLIIESACDQLLQFRKSRKLNPSLNTSVEGLNSLSSSIRMDLQQWNPLRHRCDHTVYFPDGSEHSTDDTTTNMNTISALETKKNSSASNNKNKKTAQRVPRGEEIDEDIERMVADHVHETEDWWSSQATGEEKATDSMDNQQNEHTEIPTTTAELYNNKSLDSWNSKDTEEMDRSDIDIDIEKDTTRFLADSTSFDEIRTSSSDDSHHHGTRRNKRIDHKNMLFSSIWTACGIQVLRSTVRYCCCLRMVCGEPFLSNLLIDTDSEAER